MKAVDDTMATIKSVRSDQRAKVLQYANDQLATVSTKAEPAAPAAPVTGKPGVQGAATAPPTPAAAAPAAQPAQKVAEGGRRSYVRESAAARLQRQFANFVETF
jgi:hypothetical protein